MISHGYSNDLHLSETLYALDTVDLYIRPEDAILKTVLSLSQDSYSQYFLIYTEHPLTNTVSQNNNNKKVCMQLISRTLNINVLAQAHTA